MPEIYIKYYKYIWEGPAETGHRARMIFFKKNGFQYSTRVFVRKKAFRNKNNGTIGKSRKKSIDIGPWFFFSKTQHTIMSELNRAPFTRKRHRARSVARFCWMLPYMCLRVCGFSGSSTLKRMVAGSSGSYLKKARIFEIFF